MLLIIKRKGESRNEGNKKIKYDKFSEYFLPLGTHTYVRNVCFLGKFQVLCFFATFLPYYWRCKVHHILVYCNDEICFSSKGENSNFWKLKFKSFSRLNTYYKASRLSDGNLLTEELKFSFFKFFRLVFCCCFFSSKKMICLRVLHTILEKRFTTVRPKCHFKHDSGVSISPSQFSNPLKYRTFHFG